MPRLSAAACAVAAALALASPPLPAAAATPRRAAPSAARAPVAPVTVDHPAVDGLASFDNGPRAAARIALTFDADMTPGMLAQLRAGRVRSWYNAEVRDILDSERVPATVFLTGLWAEAYPEVARSLAEDPLLEIGSHTYDHAAFRTPCYGLAAASDRAAEIAGAERAIEQAAGVRPRLLRFPGDCYDRSDVALAAAAGLRVISGDVRGGDAFNPNAAGIASGVLNAVRPGSIVVLHLHGGPNAPMTAPALRLIIAGARQRGLAFATVSQLLGASPASPEPGRAPVLAGLRSTALAAPAAAPPSARLDRLRRLALRPPLRLSGQLYEHLLP